MFYKGTIRVVQSEDLRKIKIGTKSIQLVPKRFLQPFDVKCQAISSLLLQFDLGGQKCLKWGKHGLSQSV